jgi:hypothetical protein
MDLSNLQQWDSNGSSLKDQCREAQTYVYLLTIRVNSLGSHIS